MLLTSMVIVAVACSQQATSSVSTSGLPLRLAGQIGLPGGSSRFDYASIDPVRGLLFAAHLGADQVIEVDLHTRRVVRTIGSLDQVHGVLVVPELHRVFATATGQDKVVAIDEDTGRALWQSPTGDYPDGLAYDPVRRQVWTTNESGGSETVVDAATGTQRGTVVLGGEAGNVAYDTTTGSMLADVQTRNQLAVLDPAGLTVTRRVELPGCDHDHGLTVDVADRLAFVACDGNAALLTVDLTSWQVTGSSTVGRDPDVLVYDAGAGRLYVAAESGWVTILDRHSRQLGVVGRSHLADGAHVVAVDPTTHHSYYPIPHGPAGSPVLLDAQPT